MNALAGPARSSRLKDLFFKSRSPFLSNHLEEFSDGAEGQRREETQRAHQQHHKDQQKNK